MFNLFAFLIVHANLRPIDFNREAANAIKIKSLILQHPTLHRHVVVPEVDLSRTTGRVLTMEFMEGVKIKNVPEEDRQIAAQTVLDLFSAMFFTFGFVHCDPHFGNFLVTKRSKEHPDPRLVLLDHGLYRQLDDGFVQNNGLLWRSMITSDKKNIRKSMELMGIPQYTDLFPLLLTNRPISSKARLGDAISKAELNEAKKLVGFGKGLSIGKFLMMADGLPVDMLFVLRTMHLIKDLHRGLGGENRDRFYTYGKAASAAPDSVPARTVSGTWRIFKFNTGFQLHEFLLGAQGKLFGWVPTSIPSLGGKRESESSGTRFSISQLVSESYEGGGASKP